VEIDGCEVSRASLHNLSFIEDLELMPGNRILVSKRNLIIPHVEDNLDRGGFVLESAYPHRCPCCGEPTRIHETRGRNENGEERTIKTLFCDNAGCETRKLKQFVHFVGKKAMNIEGLSEATLEKLIGRGWIHSYLDIYRLDQHKDELVRMDGFGERFWQRLWSAIQQSRNTTFERYVIAMDIPMIGNTASGVLCQVFHGNLDEFRDAVYAGYDFRQLPDFGDTLHNNIHEWFSKEENFCIWEELQMMMIQKPVQPVAENNTQDNPFAGKTIVVTGKVEPYTRDEMNSLIASLGAIAGSSVTRKTHYLVCGEKAGSKLSKARELGIPVLEPQEFFRMAGVA
jgi:NAD-dependent DNA ligase OB-fold domain